MLVEKNFANVLLILLPLVNLALLLYFLINPHLIFNPSLKLIISCLVWFTHWRHFSDSFDLACGLPSHIHFRSIILNHSIQLFYGLIKYTCLGIILHQYICMVGFCRHFKSAQEENYLFIHFIYCFYLWRSAEVEVTLSRPVHRLWVHLTVTLDHTSHRSIGVTIHVFQERNVICAWNAWIFAIVLLLLLSTMQ